MTELGVAIFGAGRAGHGHARAIEHTPDARLAAVFDVDRERADSFAEAHGCLAFTDSDDVLKRSDVDLVMVALPNFLHERATLEAASAGKHVFLEKPMADTLEECDRILAAVSRAGIHLLVAHSQRYFASTILAREIVKSGQIGQPVFATDTWYKPFGVEMRLPWFLDRATGGGMWLMNGAHMIDRTCWVLDTEVESVRAWIGSPIHGLSADDANMAFLQLRNGLHATIVHAGYKARGVEKCEVEVTGTDGMLRFDSYSNRVAVDLDGAYSQISVEWVDPFTEELKNLVGAVRGREQLRVAPAWGRHILEVLEPIQLERVDPFTEELKNLVAAIQGRAELRVAPAWGRHILEVLLAAEESSRSKREIAIQSRVLAPA